MDDVLTELRLAAENIERMGAAQRRFNAATQAGQDALWKDLAEVRDEVCAVANRLENLTRALMAEPAEVAEKIVRGPSRGPCLECGVPIYMDADHRWRGDDGELHTCHVKAVRDADA